MRACARFGGPIAAAIDVSAGLDNISCGFAAHEVRFAPMYDFSIRNCLVDPEPANPSSAIIPKAVIELAGREREVATIVYEQGPCTAKFVQAGLSVPLSSGAVRSMLTRLVKKGLLAREGGCRGAYGEAVYHGSVTPDDLGTAAIRAICSRYFEGSLLKVALSALEMLDHDRPNGRGHAAYPGRTAEMAIPSV